MSYNKETKMYEGYIYCITNNVNNKKYIGQTRYTVQSRWKQHKYDSNNRKKSCRGLYGAISKYGIDNFTISTIEKIERFKKDELLLELNKKEILYIEKCNTMISNGNGYNITIGGNNVSVYLTKPVDMYSKDGLFEKSYNSIMDIYREYGCMPIAVSNCCRGKNKVIYGHVFRFKGEAFNKYSIIPSNFQKIYQYTMDGKFIAEFNSCVDAANSVGGKDNTISSASDKSDLIHKSAYGYLWTRIKGEIPIYINNKLSKIDKYDLDGNFIDSYKSAMEAGFSIGGIKSSQIIDVCVGYARQCHGFIFRYNGDSFNKYNVIKPDHYKLKEIMQFDLKGNYIQTFKSAKEASKILNIGYGSFTQCCTGRNKSAGGYIWKYANELNEN